MSFPYVGSINIRQLFYRVKTTTAFTKKGYTGVRTASMVITFLTWPALAYFTKLTLDEDAVEHVERASRVNKNYPYMGNPTGIQFTWGTPCNYLDFECYNDFRKKKYNLDGVPRDPLFANQDAHAHH